MNAINLAFTRQYFVYPACLIGGYVLHTALMFMNQIAAKRFSYPCDLLDNQTYETYTETTLAEMQTLAKKEGLEFSRRLGIGLRNFIIDATVREISYRFFLEAILLRSIFRRFGSYAIPSACLSNLLFTARFVEAPFSPDVIRGLSINSAVLGVICSIAQAKIGLLASVFIHIGYNYHGWQYIYNQNFRDSIQRIRAMHLSDICHYGRILEDFIFEAEQLYSGMVITCRLAKSIFNASYNFLTRFAKGNQST